MAQWREHNYFLFLSPLNNSSRRSSVTISDAMLGMSWARVCGLYSSFVSVPPFLILRISEESGRKKISAPRLWTVLSVSLTAWRHAVRYIWPNERHQLQKVCTTSGPSLPFLLTANFQFLKLKPGVACNNWTYNHIRTLLLNLMVWWQGLFIVWVYIYYRSHCFWLMEFDSSLCVLCLHLITPIHHCLQFQYKPFYCLPWGSSPRGTKCPDFFPLQVPVLGGLCMMMGRYHQGLWRFVFLGW